MKFRLTALCLSCIISSLALLHAQDLPGPTPAQAWQRLKDGNERFVADKPEKKDVGANKREALAKGQAPFAIVLSCADSRVPPELLFNQGLGDLFVLRVAGNISDPFVMGSIDYGVEHLHAPLIVVLGHEKCGAVEAVLAKAKPGGNLGKLLNEIHVGKNLPDDKSKVLSAAVRNNAQFQAEQVLMKSEIVKKHVADKKLRVVSGYYGLSSGKVEWLTQK
jgi:carbonic anhydrase